MKMVLIDTSYLPENVDSQFIRPYTQKNGIITNSFNTLNQCHCDTLNCDNHPMLLPPNATEMDPIKMLEHPIDLNATTQISGSANSDSTDSSALPVHIRTKKHNKANVTIGDAIMITVGQARPLHVI